MTSLELPAPRLEIPHLWIPGRRELELPPWRIPPRRPAPARALPPLTIVQTASGTNNGAAPGPRATFASPLTPGNILLAHIAQQAASGFTQDLGNTLTQIGSLQRAHAAFGSWVSTYYRKIVAGDGQAYGFIQNGFSGLRVLEVSGLSFAGSPANLTEAGGIASATIACPGVGTAAVWGFASVVTRLENVGNAAIAVNAATTQAAGWVLPNNSIGGCVWLYGLGDAVLGGTQSGTTRDGYNFGYTAFTWAPASTSGFAGEPGGGLW